VTVAAEIKATEQHDKSAFALLFLMFRNGMTVMTDRLLFGFDHAEEL
jgi:hypothetical protein